MENEKKVLCQVKLIEGSQLHFRHEDGRDCYEIIDHRWYFDIESLIIGDLLGGVSRLFFSKMNGRFMLDNTVRLNIGYYDSDSLEEEIKERTKGKTNYFSLGSYPVFARIGSCVCSISRSHFHNLPTDERKLSYLAGRVYHSLITFCQVFKQDTSEIIRAYEEIKTISDWYLPHDGGKKTINKEGTHKVWIQCMPGYSKDKYRLVIQYQDSLEKVYFFIGEKDSHHKIFREYDLNRLILKGNYKGIPGFSFDVIGWKKKGKVFQFKWGEEELYEFSLDTMELVVKKISI